MTAKASATASAAPEALPSRNGSASGLRNSPCATAPASPSSAPASQAPSVRGRRMSHTICHATASWRARSTLSKPVLPTLAPSARPKTASASSASASHAVRAMPARGAEEDSAGSVMDAGNLRGWPLGMESGVGPLLSSACSYNF